MKKKFFKSFIILITLTFAFLLCCSQFIYKGQVNAEEQTEQEPIKYELIPQIYNADGQAQSKYNINAAKNLYPYQPFDYENNARMAGYSFRFDEEERFQINNQYILLDNHSNIELNQNLSLFVWIYFDSYYVHNLTIMLELENGSTLKWQYSLNVLFEMLSDGEESVSDTRPFAWNLFELKFTDATVTGTLSHEDKLSAPTKMTIDYSSTAELNNMARLMFYNPYISTSSQNIYVIQKNQAYSDASFFAFETDILESVCVGDTLKIPSKDKAIKYAWIGEKDLKNANNVVRKVYIEKPDQSLVNVSFSENYTFEEEGEYKIIYRIYDNSIQENSPVMTYSKDILVQSIRGVYFNKTSYDFEVGKKYILKVSASSSLEDVTDFEFTVSSQNVEINYIGNGKLEVSANKAGKYQITAKVKGTRPASPSLKEYQTKIDVKFTQEKTKDNKVLRIVLFSCLGVLVLSLAIYGINLLVKVNKYNVK